MAADLVIRCALALLATAAIALAPAVGARAQPAGATEQFETSAGDACDAIHQALSGLAQAERDQALALELFSRGGELPMVEARLQRLQQISGDLREILRRVHAGRLATDPSVSECLKLGYQALFAAERVTSEVERVLIKARGEPLASERTRPPRASATRQL